MITIKEVLEDYEYMPATGTEYEVYPGVVVTMKPPTANLQDVVIDLGIKATEGQAPKDTSDEKIARMVTDGEWPAPGDVVPHVVGRIVADFFYLCKMTTRGASRPGGRLRDRPAPAETLPSSPENGRPTGKIATLNGRGSAPTSAATAPT